MNKNCSFIITSLVCYFLMITNLSAQIETNNFTEIEKIKTVNSISKLLSKSLHISGASKTMNQKSEQSLTNGEYKSLNNPTLFAINFNVFR